MNWKELCQAEPRLKTLLKRARQRAKEEIEASKSTGWVCANRLFYGEFKEQICQLVGWDRKGDNEKLASPKAYDLVYEKIYSVMPYCNNCNGCWRM